MAVVKTERVSEEEYKARLEEMEAIRKAEQQPGIKEEWDELERAGRGGVEAMVERIKKNAAKFDLMSGVPDEKVKAAKEELERLVKMAETRKIGPADILQEYQDLVSSCEQLLPGKEFETTGETMAIQKAELRKVLAKEPVGEGVNERQYQEWLSVWKKVASAQQNDQVAYHDEYMKAMDKPTRFDELLEAMRVLHARKEKDYGAIDDPKCNIRASEEIGIPAWKACWMRARDKVRRIDKFCRDGVLENEGVKDSLLDLANYCLLMQILLEEFSGVLSRTPDGNEVGK